MNYIDSIMNTIITIQSTGAVINKRLNRYDVIYENYIVGINLSYERALNIALSKTTLQDLFHKKTQISA